MNDGLRWPRLETRWLMLVSICYVTAQPLLFHMDRYLSWDEAVYVSQLYHGVTPIAFSASRARGLPWLLSPVSAFGPPVIIIRYYVLLLLGTLFFMAFQAWVPIVRMRAVAAAALFATGWLTLFYGTEIFPNLPVALGGICAAGYVAQHLSRQVDDRAKRRALVRAAVAVALVAIVRPTDATFLAMGLLAAMATLNVRLLLSRSAALGVGLAVGWLPWVIEAYLSYGGVISRLHAASGASGLSGFHPANLWHYLALTDGPLAGTANATAPLGGQLWWSLLAMGIAFAIWRALGYGDRTAAVAACGGAASAVQYLLFQASVQARFLLPVYGLLTVCLLAALPSVPAARALRVGVWAVIALSFAVYAGWNFRIARTVENHEYLTGQTSLELAQVLRKLSPNHPCFFASQYAFPPIEFASGCKGGTIYTMSTTITFPTQPGSAPVYAFTATDPTKLLIQPLAGTVHRLHGTGPSNWWWFVAPRDAVRVVAP